MEQPIADGAKPENEVLHPKRKGKKNIWLLVGGLILLVFLSNGKQPSNGTTPPPKVTPTNQQVSPPKTKSSKRDWWIIISVAVVFGSLGIWGSLAAHFSTGTAAFVNATSGVLIAIVSLLLNAEEVTKIVKPGVLQVIVLSLGLFSFGQAFMTFGLLGAG